MPSAIASPCAVARSRRDRCPALAMSVARDRCELVPVAIVTFGLDTSTGSAVTRAIDGFGWSCEDVWDLRPHLQDPRDNTSRVKFQKDGSHEWTQRAIFSQSNFPWVAQQCVEEVIERTARGKGVVVLRACKTGYHRCDTEGRLEKEILNRLEVTKSDGNVMRSMVSNM